MYPAVLANIPGLAPVLGDWRLVAYGAVFGFACHILVVIYEEPRFSERSAGNMDFST